MRTVIQDVRLALRLMARAPGFTAAAVVTIALAVGANTAIFSLVYGVLWRPLPYPEAGSLVRLSEEHPGGVSPLGEALLSSLTYDAWERSGRTVGPFGAYTSRTFTVADAGEPERIRGSAVTPSVLAMLGAAPAQGRLFTEADAVQGAAPVAVLGHDYWRARFGGDPAVVGRTITIDGASTEIVGVAPAGFSFPRPDASIYTPFIVRRPDSASPGAVGVMFVLARLRPGVTPEQAAAEGTAIARAQERPLAADMLFGKGGPVQVHVRGLAAEATSRVRPAMLVLFAGVGLLLLVACANVANLFLSRGAGRSREMAVRAALGAGRGRIARQLLTESMTFALAGGTLGVALAFVLVRALPALAPAEFPRLEQVAVDGGALLVTLAASLLVGILAGLMPALRGARHGIGAAMRQSDVRTMAGGGGRVRSALLVAEAALAVVLLVGAGLVGRSFAALTSVDAGYEASNVLMGEVYLTGAAAEGRRPEQFATELLARVRAMPGVAAAGTGNMAPFGNSTSITGFTIPGSTGPDGKPVVARALQYDVTPGYAEALGLRLRDGRLFAEADVTRGIGSYLVNETFARTYFTDGRPIVGRQWQNFGREERTAEIIGVVGDVLKDGLDSERQAEIYRVAGPALQGSARSRTNLNLVVRTTGDPAALGPAIREAVRAVEPSAAIDRVGPLAARVSQSVGEPRFAAAVLIAFAALGLLLAATGLYGVLSYTVTTRRREIGVRAALGAERRDLIALVVRQGLGVTVIGIAAGIAAAALLTRLMEKLLFGIEPLDPVSFAVAPAVLLLVALAACVLPAARAAGVEPAEALREG
ncbi:MAG TPA: ABC transporter permease [Vicinamibacterales bacterium]